MPDSSKSTTICASTSGSVLEENDQADLLHCAPPNDLFPLPLTDVERFMFEDDHRAYPKTFTVVLHFAGKMNRPAFEQAMLEVVRRNPLLSAVVRKHNSRWHWQPAPFPRDQITWGECDWELNDRTIDLQSTPGFRASGRTDGSDSEVHLSFHHAVSDGQGSRRVILDWLTFYAAMTSDDEKKTPADQLDYDRLRIRGHFTRKEALPNSPSVTAAPPTLSYRLRTIYEFLSQQPVPIRPGDHRPRRSARTPAHLLTTRFDRGDVTRFRDRLRGSRISLNDVAIGLLLNAIAKWNRGHGETGRDRLYRILVPVDLRESGDELMPATNRLSLVFITRPTSLCLDWPRLLTTIRTEMDYIDEHGCKYNFVNALPTLGAIPGALPLLVKVPVCLSTAILTNLGDTVGRLRHRFPKQNNRPLIGNLEYVRSIGTPPLRPKTRLGIGMTISLGEMVIQSQFDSNAFSSTDAAQFMQLLTDNWKNWADSTPEFQAEQTQDA